MATVQSIGWTMDTTELTRMKVAGFAVQRFDQKEKDVCEMLPKVAS